MRDIKKEKLFWFGVFLYLFLNILDIVTTYIFLKIGFVEGNPFANLLFEKIGFLNSAILKINTSLISVGLLYFVFKKKRLLAYSILYFISGVVFTAVLMNTLLIFYGII